MPKSTTLKWKKGNRSPNLSVHLKPQCALVTLNMEPELCCHGLLAHVTKAADMRRAGLNVENVWSQARSTELIRKMFCDAFVYCTTENSKRTHDRSKRTMTGHFRAQMTGAQHILTYSQIDSTCRVSVCCIWGLIKQDSSENCRGARLTNLSHLQSSSHSVQYVSTVCSVCHQE